MIDRIDYVEIAEDVIETLHEAGQGMVLVSAGTPGYYDEIKDEYTEPVPEEYVPFYGVTTDVSLAYATKAASSAQTMQLRDRIILADAVNITPKLTDHVYVHGEKWSLINITPIDPAGVPVLYELHVRP